jgi:CBS domain-containing protein
MRDALEMEARDLMTPGVVSIADDASLSQVHRALRAHRVHAVLVVGHRTGRALGWVTARGLLAWLSDDPSLACASDAITERAVTIQPSATGREAVAALGRPQVSRLLVQRHAEALPEGVISDLDLIIGPRG